MSLALADQMLVVACLQTMEADQQPMSLQEALLYATQLHRNNQLEGAETLYQRILEAAPGQPDALHFLGLIRFQRLSGVPARSALPWWP